MRLVDLAGSVLCNNSPEFVYEFVQGFAVIFARRVV